MAKNISNDLGSAVDSYFDDLVKSRFIELFGDVLTNSKGFETVKFGDYVTQMNIGPFGSDLKNDCFVSESDGYCMVYEQKHAIDKDFTVEKRFITKEKYNQMRRFDVGPGDILVSCRGTIGKCVLLPENAEHGVIHPSLMMIKPKDDVNHAFLLSLLEKILDVQVEKGSGVKMAIKATELSKLEVIKPPRELQDEFINFIEQVDKSKFVMRKLVSKYDELVKSRFIELFSSYYGKDTCSDLESLCDVFVDGDWIESKDQSESGIRLIQTGNVGNGEYLDKSDKSRFINDATFENLNCTEVLPGDILVSRLPDPIGRSCIVPEGIGKSITGVDCTIIRLKDSLNPVFFNKYTLTDKYQAQVSTFEAGSTRKRISRKNLGKLLVPVPPRELQDQFAEFVKQVDKSKIMLIDKIHTVCPTGV